MFKPNVIVAIVVMLAIQIVGVYDAVAMMFFGNEYTVSVVVKTWSRQFPIIPIMVGLVLGHLFWPVLTLEQVDQKQNDPGANSRPRDSTKHDQ